MGVGLYLPPKIETAEDIAPKIEKPVDWIIEKSGVSERRVSEIDVDQTGAMAGKEALGDGGKPDLIINASGKAVDAYISTGGFAKEKVVSIISEFGNCVAASVPMAFTTAVQDGRIKRGDLLLFIGTGAGLSAACALIKY